MAHGSGYSDAARHQAQHILSQPPFTNTSHPPRPLAGVLHAIGHALSVVFGPIFRWIGAHLVHPINSGLHVAFGPWAPAVAVAIAVALGVGLGQLLVRRRARVARRAPAAGSEGTRIVAEDPGLLEDEARRAEAGGDHERAVRLRFRAGLLRLERRGLIANRDVTTSTQLSGRLHSPTFDALAGRHESIVYGGDAATPADAAAARDRWPSVLDEARTAERVGAP